jgi:hypothetical protein
MPRQGAKWMGQSWGLWADWPEDADFCATKKRLRIRRRFFRHSKVKYIKEQTHEHYFMANISPSKSKTQRLYFTKGG